jgi:lipid-A-disaccharide synthase-like uncharacterized protein
VNRWWLIWVLVAFAAVAGAVVGLRWALRDAPTDDPNAVTITIRVDGALDRAQLLRNADGTHDYILRHYDGSSTTLAPEQLAARLYAQEESRNLLAYVFNISTPFGIIWVGIGLLGQLLFTGRMLVQWLTSEREKRSVVPAAFWWMSLGGAVMLLSYFLWRRDVVGVLGQSFGLIIYIRNIHLIYRYRTAVPATVDPAPAPAPGPEPEPKPELDEHFAPRH